MRIQMEADGSQAVGGFSLVPEGEYIAQVVTCVGGRTKKGDRDKADIRFDIQDMNGKKIGSCFETITFIPKGEPGHGIWLHINHALGMPYDGMLDFDTDEYIGKSARVKVVIESYTKIDGTTNKKNKIAVFYTDGNSVTTTTANSVIDHKHVIDHIAEKAKKQTEDLPF